MIPRGSSHRTLRRAVLLGTILACGGSSLGAAEGPAAPPRLVLAPGASEADATAVREALASVVVLAVAPEGMRPGPDAAEACGLVVGAGDGLLTTWRYLARAAQAPRGSRLWARAVGGAWEPVVPLGRTWWCDAGVARFALARPRRPVRRGEAPRAPRGRGVTLGPLSQGRVEVRSAPLLAVEWFDPAVPGGRAGARRGGADRVPSPRAWGLSLRYGAGLRGPALEGAPVLDAGGACVGMVTAVDAGGAEAEVVARPLALLAPWVESILASAAFDPLDLGVRFAPGPVREGATPEVPGDLRLVREGGKESGGAVVVHVEPRGPSVGLLWPGDVVLEVGGEALVGEVYETLARTAGALAPDGPSEVVVWRGGRRESLRIAARRASTIYPDAAAEFEARGAPLR